MGKINKKEFNKIRNDFEKLEKRGSLYPVFLKMISDDYLYESFIFILSTWNFASFRYAMRDFNFIKFERLVKRLKKHFRVFSHKNFKDLNFQNYKKEIGYIFDSLSDIKGIKSTGAPKLMHLACPKVFVMWDGYIRKYYNFRKDDKNDYINFLSLMQKLFSKINFNSKKITFAKAIDEYNYRKITIPALAKQKKKQKSNFKK